MEVSTALPPPPPPPLRSFLNHHFRSVDDIANAPSLLARLSDELRESQDRLSRLHASTAAALSAWAGTSSSVASSLSSVERKLSEFEGRSSPTFLTDSDGGDLFGRLPVLAAEVARVERVRLYAETALQLEALVGDLEDAVAAVVIGTPRIQLPRKMVNSPAPEVLIDLSSKFSSAIASLQKIEDVIGETIKSWPQWKRLLVAVDIRVDKTVASLRPSAIADYRSKLAEIRWPPPLSVGLIQEGAHSDLKAENPLVKLNGEMKQKFESSFVSLSALQALQCRRKARQAIEVSHKRLGNGNYKHNHEILWAIEEMMTLIGSRAAVHFLKWSENPDLIFGLAYQVAQQHVEIIDTVLQPMLDRVRLAGYCVREEWISAVSVMLMNHLRSHTLPELVEKLSDDVKGKEESSYWLHIVDLAISFDKKMHSLSSKSIGPLASKVELDFFDADDAGLESVIKCVTVFAERKEWLDLWSQLELVDAQRKLNRELQDERAWSHYTPSDVVSSAVQITSFAQEDFRHPQGAEATMLRMWTLINRCRSLPRDDWKLEFIRNVGSPFVKDFLGTLLQRCQEAEATTALSEEGAVVKVASCINASCYCEHKLLEWSEDVFFLDLRRLQISLADDQCNSKISGVKVLQSGESLVSVQGCVFDEELSCLVQFKNEWLQKVVSATLRAFDACCQDYQRNKKRWQEYKHSLDIVDATVSSSFIDALAILQLRLRMLGNCLGGVVFVDFWRGLALVLDQFFLNSVILGGARFSELGSTQLACDIHALFQIFRPFCVRPSSFFPSLCDTVILLSMRQDDVLQLQQNLSGSSWGFRDQGDEDRSGRLKECGLRCIDTGLAAKILSVRTFSKT